MTSDRSVGFDSDDPEMTAAIQAARLSLAEFLRAFANPKSGQTSFLVKAVFSDGEEFEHIWLADLDLSSPRLRGVVANEPILKTIRFMDTVECEPTQITDWMYVDRGKLVGGLTTRLIRERMSPQERFEFDANTPYSF
jgi:uncharacterized protein YegJ (DUF2314 family)